MSKTRSFNAKLELRAITKSQRNRERAVMRSSVIPSAKYSCSRSPLRLAKGRTTMDGLPESGRAFEIFATRDAARDAPPYWLLDVLDLLCSEIGKVERENSFHVLVCRT